MTILKDESESYILLPNNEQIFQDTTKLFRMQFRIQTFLAS